MEELASCSTCSLPRICYRGTLLGVLGFLPSPRGKKVWAKAEIQTTPQLPLRQLLLLLPKMAALPQMLFLLWLAPIAVHPFCGLDGECIAYICEIYGK